MILDKSKTIIILIVLIFCLTACSNGSNNSNRLSNLKSYVTQDNLIYHIELIEHNKNINAYNKALFQHHSEEFQEFDKQGNIVHNKTFLIVKVSIENKSEKEANLFVNGIEIYKVDQQLNIDMQSGSKMEYFSRSQKNEKETYKAVIASKTKETYEFGYFVDDAILNDPTLCMVINPKGYQLNDKNIHFISLNK